MPRIGKSRPLMAMLFGAVAMLVVVACGGGESSSRDTAAPTSVPARSSKLDTLPSKLDPGSKPLSEAAEALSSIGKAMPDAEAMSEALALVEDVMSDPDAMSGALALVEDVMSDPEAMSGALALVEDVMSDPEAMSGALALVEDVMSDPEAISDALASVQDASPAPALPSKYDAFGFTVNVDQGTQFRTADGSVDAKGALSFAIGDVNTILTWVPGQGSTPLTLVSGTYDILRDNQTGILFESISDGEISASGQPGVFLGFKSSDDSGNSLGGGLIGAWACADAGDE